MKLHKTKIKIHFIGIGGIGMSGLAELFFKDGYAVSGSDVQESEATLKLKKLGITVFIGHDAKNIEEAQVVVVSSAIRPTNPELLEARKRKLSVIPRAEMLGELMRGKVGVSVGGTHGKTTTTSLIGTLYKELGLDPTLVIGGKVDSIGGNALLGKGQYVIAEADESDSSFLYLPSTFVIVTNIDNDHLDHYQTVEQIDAAFIQFVNRIPFYGKAFVCLDDVGVRRCLDRFNKPFVTYGIEKGADFKAKNLKMTSEGSSFEVYDRGQLLGTIQTKLFGKHNVLNSLAAIAMALEAGLSFKDIQTKIVEFKGVRRRFDVRYFSEKKHQVVLEDYGHHPTEIQATLESVRQFWNGKVITIFQPHRFSRTQQCYSEFLRCFQKTDVLMLMDIYSAGEDPIPEVHSQKILEGIKNIKENTFSSFYEADLSKIKKFCLDQFQSNTLILFLGAGSIHKFLEDTIHDLSVD